MANPIFQMLRRLTGQAGVPAAGIKSGVLFDNNVDGVLYIGRGDDGTGKATSIVAVGGSAKADAAATTAAFAQVNSAVTNESNARSAAHSALSSSIAAEATRASNAEQALQGSLSALQSAGYQTAAQVSTAIQNVVGTAPAALNTLQKIAAQLAADEDAASAITTSVSNESVARAAADSNLQNQINALPTTSVMNVAISNAITNISSMDAGLA